MSYPLSGYRWLRLATVPRVADVPDPRRWLTSSISAAIVMSHAELLAAPPVPGSPAGLAVAWVRPIGSDRVHFLLGGRPVFPPVREGPPARPGGAAAVLFPPGATAEPLADDRPRRWFTDLPVWLRCLGGTDVPMPSVQPDGVAGMAPPAGLDDYALHLGSAFVWLMAAEPVGPGLVDDEAAQTTARLTTIRKRENSESHRIDLERGQRRLRELTRARASGLWRLQTLVGALDPVGARQAAALLCSAVDLSGSGYLLFPDEKHASLEQTWDTPVTGPDRATGPFLAGSDLVAALFRPPVRELPGITLIAPYRFDVTPSSDASGAELGTVLDEAMRPVGRFTVPHPTLNRHGFICGATGSGKSQTGRRLLESLSTGVRRIPWLVVEPAKAEYSAMAGRLRDIDEVLVIRPGELGAAPASLNPLEPEPGFPLQSHADLVRALFLAAFEAEEPFPQVLSHALTECYSAAGWNLVSGRLRRGTKPKYRIEDPDESVIPRYPSLRELQATARRVVDRIGYGPEVTADVRGFVDVRMGSLRQGAPGRFFEGGHPLDVAALLERNVVLELEAITNDQDKAFLMGTVLIRVVEHLRVRGPVERLRHVVLIEEAHRLLKNVGHGPAAAAVELFAALLAEIRAYGEGVVIVEQIPSKILPDVIKNTAFKVVHRLPAQDDRDAVGATMNLTEANAEAVVSFPPGIAAVSIDGDDRPLLIGVAGGQHRETSAGVNRYPPFRGRRSLLCGPDCRSRACSLGQMDDAAAVTDEAAVVVWSEAVAASMVLGDRPPRPRRVVIDAWAPPGRERDCALATLAGRAVDARRVRLIRWIDPDDFADRLRTVLLALVEERPVPATDAGRWRAGAFRWRETYRELRSIVRAADTEAVNLPPHVRTEEWRALGLDLDADSLAGQFEQLKNDPAYAEGSERVVFGDVETSGLQQALIELAGSATANGLGRALEYACEMKASDPLLVALRGQFVGPDEMGSHNA